MKNNIVRLIFFILVMTVVILCIEFYHLNTGIMRNLSSNLNEIKHGIQQIEMLTEDNDLEKQEIRDLLIKSAETLEFDLSGENGSRYNLLTDRADIKSMIKEFEENL